MRQSNSHRPVDGLKRAMVVTLPDRADSVSRGACRGRAGGRDFHAARPRFALGSEVVLKLPGLPIFDQGRPISAGDNLTFMVDRSEAGRLLLVSRDQKIRGWAYEDEVVPFEQATGYFGQVVAERCSGRRVILGARSSLVLSE